MIPGNQLSDLPYVGNFLEDFTLVTPPLEAIQRGGVALSDGTKGVDLKYWKFQYSPQTEEVTLSEVGGTLHYFLVSIPDLVYLSGAFNSNMDWYLACQLSSGDCKFYYYDTLTESREILNLPAGSTTPRCSLDDKRALQEVNRDVILTYINGGNLIVRNQRERFEFEHVIYSQLPQGSELVNFGMTSESRMQWEFSRKL